MANTLPLNVEMGALPPSVRWTPQQLADAIAQRLRITTQQTFALFVTGSTEPSSNVGPWLKNGNEWYVFSDIAGGYVPITIAQESLGYFIGEATPDPTVYQFWIRTTAGGSPLGISIYYSGSWVDVYAAQLANYQTVAAMANYSTTAEMNAAIAAAIAGIPGVTIVAGQGSFKTKPASQQDIIFGAGGTLTGGVNLGSTVFNPDGNFGGSKFTAPAAGYYQFNSALNAQVTSGSPTTAEISGFVAVNGVNVDSLSDESVIDQLGYRVLTGAHYLQLGLGDEVTMTYQAGVDAAATFSIFPTYTQLSGYRVR